MRLAPTYGKAEGVLKLYHRQDPGANLCNTEMLHPPPSNCSQSVASFVGRRRIPIDYVPPAVARASFINAGKRRGNPN